MLYILNILMRLTSRCSEPLSEEEWVTLLFSTILISIIRVNPATFYWPAFSLLQLVEVEQLMEDKRQSQLSSFSQTYIPSKTLTYAESINLIDVSNAWLMHRYQITMLCNTLKTPPYSCKNLLRINISSFSLTKPRIWLYYIFQLYLTITNELIDERQDIAWN